LEDLDPDFLRPVEADLRIVLTWDDEYSDIDLWVTEPSGEEVYYESMDSVHGGFLADDFTDGLGPEVYTIVDAPAGRYDIAVDFFDDSGPSLVGPVTVRARIITNFGRENEKTIVRTTRLNEVDERFDVGSVTIDAGDDE
jgi:uncharacterized protein YfaP (DUF2135 family)